MLRQGEILISELNAHEYTRDVEVGGERKARGLIPRPYESHPVGHYRSAPPFEAVDFPLIPQGEWSQRIKDKVAEKSQLSDIRLAGNGGQAIPSLDQNGKGYCWAHSSTGAVMMLRAAANQPYVPLSAYAVACVIKNYKDEGGWGAQSLDFITERGVPSQQFWPQQSMARSNDRPETWENAKLHKVTAGWVDLQAAQYDRKLSFQQEISLLLSNVPVVKDENWWGHSICGLDAVDGASARPHCRAESGKLLSLDEFDRLWGMNDPVTAGTGVRILNSWGDSWSDRGMGTLAGSKAVSDGAVAPRVVTASVS